MTGQSPRDSCKPLFEDLGLLLLPATFMNSAFLLKNNLRLFTKAIESHNNPDKLNIPGNLKKRKTWIKDIDLI